MSSNVAEIRTGTMGWSYDDWRGPFYAAGAPSARLLEEYAKVFSTVELDTTFYGVPRPSTLDGWAAQVPDGFLFTAKVPRAVTHERRLLNASEAAQDFGVLLQKHLGPKLGGLLLQLPPDFSAESELDRRTFDTFISELTDPRHPASTLPWVVEFRNASWVNTEIAIDLASEGIACATTERIDVGGPLRYVRLLGTENSVARFDARQIDRSQDLAVWATRLDEARKEQGSDISPILVYVRNFYEGHAPGTIFDLRTRLGLPSATPPGQQQMSLF
jgi:uncharacterized protein YecE (DUF72 family)